MIDDTTTISQSTDQVDKNSPTRPLGTSTSKIGTFGKILGGILGGALNIVAPGIGTAVGSLISGGSGANYNDMQSVINQQMQQSMSLLSVQHQLQSQTEAFTTFSNLLKTKHDSEMTAINNFKS